MSDIRKLILIIMLYFCFMPLGIAKDADTQAQISVPSVILEPGLVLQYEAYSIIHPYRPPVREDFSIRIAESWAGGVSFKYTSVDENIGAQKGLESLSSMDDCPNLDPWWDTMEIGHDDRCELWASKRVYMELASTGKSWMNIDTAFRQDTAVRWESVGKVRYLCVVDGQPVLLNAIQIKTSREDEIIMLDDPDNPLILHIKSMYFSWDLRKIDTAR